MLLEAQNYFMSISVKDLIAFFKKAICKQAHAENNHKHPMWVS